MPASLQSRLPQIAAELRPRVSKAVREGADDIGEGARRRVAVRTGATRDTIEARRAGAAQARVVVGFPGQLLERGTSRMEAQPFMVPAADEGAEPLADRVTEVLQGL